MTSDNDNDRNKPMRYRKQGLVIGILLLIFALFSAAFYVWVLYKDDVARGTACGADVRGASIIPCPLSEWLSRNVFTGESTTLFLSLFGIAAIVFFTPILTGYLLDQVPFKK